MEENVCPLKVVGCAVSANSIKQCSKAYDGRSCTPHVCNKSHETCTNFYILWLIEQLSMESYNFCTDIQRAGLLQCHNNWNGYNRHYTYHNTNMFQQYSDFFCISWTKIYEWRHAFYLAIWFRVGSLPLWTNPGAMSKNPLVYRIDTPQKRASNMHHPWYIKFGQNIAVSVIGHNRYSVICVSAI